MGSIDLPVSLFSLTINCVTLEEKESETITDYLSSTTCLKELKLNFCSGIMKMEPILRAMTTDNLLPFKRVELKCERCQINKKSLWIFAHLYKEKYYTAALFNVVF